MENAKTSLSVKPETIQAIVLDLDRPLLTSNKTISSLTLETLLA